jgi:hypothetical protein
MQVVVGVPASPTIVDFSGTPNPVTFEESSTTGVTLTWTASNADYCTSDFFAGNGPTSGNQVVNPLVTTTYNLTCVNTTLSEQVNAQLTITVGAAPSRKPIFYED